MKTSLFYRVYRMANRRIAEDGRWVLLLTGTIVLLELFVLYIDTELGDGSKYAFANYSMVMHGLGWNFLFVIGFFLCLLLLFERQMVRNRTTALPLVLPGGRGQGFLADSIAAFFLLLLYVFLQLLFFSLFCQPIMKGISVRNDNSYKMLLESDAIEFHGITSIEEERMFAEGDSNPADAATQREITEHSFGAYTGMELKNAMVENALFLVFLPRTAPHACWLLLVLFALAVVVSPPNLPVRGGKAIQLFLFVLFLAASGYTAYQDIGGMVRLRLPGNFVGIMDWSGKRRVTAALVCVVSGILIGCIYYCLLHGFDKLTRKGAGKEADDYEKEH